MSEVIQGCLGGTDAGGNALIAAAFNACENVSGDWGALFSDSSFLV